MSMYICKSRVVRGLETLDELSGSSENRLALGCWIYFQALWRNHFICLGKTSWHTRVDGIMISVF